MPSFHVLALECPLAVTCNGLHFSNLIPFCILHNLLCLLLLLSSFYIMESIPPRNVCRSYGVEQAADQFPSFTGSCQVHIEVRVQTDLLFKLLH